MTLRGFIGFVLSIATVVACVWAISGLLSAGSHWRLLGYRERALLGYGATFAANAIKVFVVNFRDAIREEKKARRIRVD